MWKSIGKGGHGRVYDQGDGTVTKIGQLGENEVQCQIEAAELGISPEVLDHSHNSLTMRKVKGKTVWQNQGLTEEQYNELEEKVQLANDNGLHHNDLSGGTNVMLTKEGVEIIDWGAGTTIFPDPERRNDDESLKVIKRRFLR